MLKAVLDTNVFVSSLLNKIGAPARLLDAAAGAIVTGDHHPLSLKAFEGIPIMTVRGFLERLSDQDSDS